MTDFTKEQLEAIEAARLKALTRSPTVGANMSWDIFINALTRKPWMPQVGEVCWHIFEDNQLLAIYSKGYETNMEGHLAPLNYTEVPYFKVAVDALKEVQKWSEPFSRPHTAEIISNALAEISRLRGESE